MSRRKTSLVGVVGAGAMGRGIAHVFALQGYRVHLVDSSPAALRQALVSIRRNLDRRDAAHTEDVLGRIACVSGAPDAVAQADLVIEAVPEELALKQRVFAELDACAPGDAILASNTSSISIASLASATARPERVVGMHFFNPVPVMKLVEIVRSPATSEAVFERALQLARDLGKEPVAVRDAPGFVSNRVLMPMINEACRCVQEGVAPPESVDKVMTLGMRHPMGPLALADFIGLDVCLSIMEVLHKGLADERYRPCALLREMVAAGRLGRKSGRGFYEYAAAS